MPQDDPSPLQPGGRYDVPLFRAFRVMLNCHLAGSRLRGYGSGVRPAQNPMLSQAQSCRSPVGPSCRLTLTRTHAC